MLRSSTLPASWRAVLDTFRPAFRRSSTFAVFTLLATGLVAQAGRRTVVGMLAAAGMTAVVSFHTVPVLLVARLGYRPDRVDAGAVDHGSAAAR
jgi:hypothetical protein